MKHYILIEVDTGHANRRRSYSAKQLAEVAVGIIMSEVGGRSGGIATIATYNTEELHNEACLLMDGVS